MEDNYSWKLVDSLKIFFLLNRDVQLSAQLLYIKGSDAANHIGFKSVYINACSFIDELEIFMAALRTESFDDLRDVNRFLLASYKVRKILNKKRDILKAMRNTLFAHNYRDDKNGKGFADPSAMLLFNFEKAPILRHELQYLGNLIGLIVSLALQSFHFNSDLAFSDLVNSTREYYRLYPAVEKAKMKFAEVSMDVLERDIYQIRDTLKSHDDNFEMMSKKLQCAIRIGDEWTVVK